MKYSFFITALLSSTILVSCDKEVIHEEAAQLKTVGSRTVIFPAEFTLEDISSDKSHYSFSKASAQSSAERSTTRAAGDYSDIAGVLAERDLETTEETPTDILSTVVTRLTSAPVSETGYWGELSDSATLARISLYDLTEAYSAVVASYNLTTSAEFTVTEVANGLSQAFSYTMANGVPEETLPTSGTAEPTGDEFYEPTDTAFRVYIVAFYLEGTSGTAFINALVLRESVYENYVTETNRSVSPSNVTSGSATYISSTNSFTTEAGNNQADFLFVIDNSGSMSDEQAAISQVATDFELTIQNSGLDYRLATITTDSSALRDHNGDGGITTELAEFKEDLEPGTSGSSSESGIYFAEQALLSIAEGDSTDGSLALETESIPRSTASLNIIMMSDEPDQYSYYASSEFDVENNLFLDRGHVVHVIVEPDTEFYDENGQYPDLATATGGLEGDINNLTSFNQIIVDISTIAGATASSFGLDEFPVSETIVVYKNGTQITRSSNNGWTNPIGSKKIVFNGTALPEAGDEIRVEYIYASSN